VGLGLYLARSIVNQLGGTITAESPPPGKSRGTVFTVRLPVWQDVVGGATGFKERTDVEPAARG
jgi:signal transduction histidine kinase